MDPRTLVEIAALKADRDVTLRHLKNLYAKLDAHRVKCPTCRCRILPGDACSCCAGRFDLEDDEKAL